MVDKLSFWYVLLGSAVLFWLLPRTCRLGFLAIISFVYLMTIDAMSVGVLVLWLIAVFLLSHRAAASAKAKRLIAPGVILALLGYLAYHKYVPTFIAQLTSDPIEVGIVIPLGISYFTFKLIHYVIEVGRGNVTDRSFATFLCYIFLFPIFTAGPIERFDHFLAQREQSWNVGSAAQGVMRIAHGLIKKFAIIPLFVTPAFKSVTSIDLLLESLALQPSYKVAGYFVLVYIYTYLDFSAYSDIAIGSSRLFGLRIMENFNWPILAPNIGNFWKRWHMTLANWCQAYVYMPTIGLTRNPYLAVYATFLAMGLWHAGTLNWVMWGGYHATGVCVFLKWSRIKRQRKWTALDRGLWRYAGIPVTFIFVTGSFIFTTTNAAGPMAALRILAKLFFIDLPA
jgi:alginate O-acetyltransferase complex protein AlgI